MTISTYKKEIPQAILSTRDGIPYIMVLILLLLRILSVEFNAFNNPVFIFLAILANFWLLTTCGIMGLAFVFFDMTAWGELFSAEQFGYMGWFKFQDIQVALIILVAFFLLKSSRAVMIDKKVRRVFFMVILIGFIYAFLSLTIYNGNFGGVLRHLRIFLYAFLIFALPYYFKSWTDITRFTKLILVFTIISSVLYITQTIFPSLPIYMYSTIISLGESENTIRIYGMMILSFFYVSLVYFPFLISQKIRLVTILPLVLILSALLFTTGRIILLIIILSFIISFFQLGGIKKHFSKIIKTVILFIAINISFGVFGIGLFNYAIERINARNVNLDSELSLQQGGELFLRTMMFLKVPDYLNTPIRLIFGAGYLYMEPENYGPIASYIYIINYLDDNSSNIIRTRNIGWIEKQTKISSFFADNGWAGIFITMGYLGLLLYIIFIIKLIKITYSAFKSAFHPLTKALFLGLFCEFLFNPLYFFFSAGYLSSPATFHICFFIVIAFMAKNLEPQRLDTSKNIPI